MEVYSNQQKEKKNLLLIKTHMPLLKPSLTHDISTWIYIVSQ